MAAGLPGTTILQIRDDILAAFPNRAAVLELFMAIDRSYDLYEVASLSLSSNLAQVLVAASSEGWLPQLLRAASAARPVDPALAARSERYGAEPVVVAASGVPPDQTPAPPAEPVTRRQLERQIKAAGSTFDIGVWRRRLGAIEGRVCRIEFPEGKARGTGFLVGPDRVLTNHHVVDAVIDCLHRPGKVVLRFDYLVGADGVSVHGGTTYRLAEEWLIHSSPPSAQDRLSDPHVDPAPDELDYALLRLATAAGDEPVGGPIDNPNETARGWIEVPDEEYPFEPRSALYIVQHPIGGPMQVALDSEAVLGRNGNGTRVRYTTTTQPGSSGSPCFDADWGLVALHQSGDPGYASLGTAAYNQGIPLSAIRALLAEQHLAAAFGPDTV